MDTDRLERKELSEFDIYIRKRLVATDTDDGVFYDAIPQRMLQLKSTRAISQELASL